METSGDWSYKQLDRSIWKTGSPSTTASPQESIIQNGSDRLTSRTPGPGFLGSTSFSAVYQEGRSLDGVQHGLSDEKTIKDGPFNRLYIPNRESQIKRGVDCLALLVDCPAMDSIIARWETVFGCISVSPFIPAIKEAVESGIYADIAHAQGKELQDILVRKSAEIYMNSMKEFKTPPGCTMSDYASLLGDPTNLRWDVVGTYFTAVGLGACYTNQTASRAVIKQRRAYAKTMMEASDTCLSLCEELGQITDTEVFLYCENAHLVSVVEGDASFMFWRRLGDFISAVITKGLHVGNNANSEVPFWLSELRNRIFCQVYNLDKSISTFMGRPPRLPRKYCAMQLPLDLNLAHLQLPAEQLEIEIGNLDDAGWNLAGEFRSSLYARTSMICNMIREDILELTLTSLPTDNLAAAENILQRSRAAWESFPPWVRELRSRGPQGFLVAHLSNEIQLNFQYNEFLLYRAISMKRSPASTANEAELLRLSATTLASVMDNFTHTNLLGKYDCDIPWTLAKFALPTAGVLALELLRQSQGHGSGTTHACFNRSAVIQSLSNLVAALEWAVFPFDGNYEICSRAKQVLQSILDRVLSSPTGSLSPTTNSPAGFVSETPGTSSIGSDYFWLNQTSSELEFWSSLPDHPLLRKG